MNDVSLLIFIYVFSIIAGVVATTILFLLPIGKSRLYTRVKIFNVALLCYSITQLLIFYFVLVGSDGMLVAVVFAFSDIAYFIFISCWVLILEGATKQTYIKRNYLIGITVAYALFTKTVSLTHAVSGNEAIVIQHEGITQKMMIAVNLCFGLLILYCAIRYIVKSINIVKHKNRGFIPIMSIVLSFGLLFCILWVMSWDYRLVASGGISGDDLAIIDPILTVYVLCCMIALAVYVKKREPKTSIPRGKDKASINSLSAREKEIFHMIAEGLSNPQIAERLFISENTVKRHTNTIYKKLGKKNRYELIVLYQKL